MVLELVAQQDIDDARLRGLSSCTKSTFSKASSAAFGSSGCFVFMTWAHVSCSRRGTTAARIESSEPMARGSHVQRSQGRRAQGRNHISPDQLIRLRS